MTGSVNARFQEGSKGFGVVLLIINRLELTTSAMKADRFELRLEISENREELFLQDPQSDFYLVCGERVFPLHKRFLVANSLFFRKISENCRFYELESFSKTDIMEEVLALFYGRTLIVEKSEKLIDYLDALLLLELDDEPETAIIEDLEQNFHCYSVFTLLYISRKFDLPFLQKQCLEELLNEKFEQLNYNKYELFHCDLETFKLVIRQHEHQKLLGRIKGIRSQNLEALIQQYCFVNQCMEDHEQLSKELINQKFSVKNQEFHTSQLQIDNRRSCPMPAYFSARKSKSLKYKTVTLSRSSSEHSNKQNVVVQKIQQIKKQNEITLLENQQLIGELNQLTKSLSSGFQKNQGDEEYKKITEGLNQVEEEFDNQDKKMEALKKNIQEMLKDIKKKASSTTQESSISESPLKCPNLLQIPALGIRPRGKSAQALNQLRMPVMQQYSDLEVV